MIMFGISIVKSVQMWFENSLFYVSKFDVIRSSLSEFLCTSQYSGAFSVIR
jgi:hypothetical protein